MHMCSEVRIIVMRHRSTVQDIVLLKLNGEKKKVDLSTKIEIALSLCFANRNKYVVREEGKDFRFRKIFRKSPPN